MPVSLFSLPCAPQIHMRTSLEALPPSTGRSWIKQTFAPLRAAAIAAQRPLMPPPTTQTSNWWRWTVNESWVRVFMGIGFQKRGAESVAICETKRKRNLTAKTRRHEGILRRFSRQDRQGRQEG